MNRLNRSAGRPKLSKAEQIAIQNRNAARRWGAMVVGLLTLQVALGVVAIRLATSDASVAVIPDYYQKSLRWDEKMADQAASTALGWTARVTAVDLNAPAASLAIELVDADGRPVAISTASVSWYHHARAGDVRSAGFQGDATPAARQPLERGQLFCPAGLETSGWWQVDLDARDSLGNHFVDSQKIKVTLESSGQDR